LQSQSGSWEKQSVVGKTYRMGEF